MWLGWKSAVFEYDQSNRVSEKGGTSILRQSCTNRSRCQRSIIAQECRRSEVSGNLSLTRGMVVANPWRQSRCLGSLPQRLRSIIQVDHIISDSA